MIRTRQHTMHLTWSSKFARGISGLAVAALLMLLISGCGDENVMYEAAKSSAVKTGYIWGADGKPLRVEYEVVRGMAIFQGDIILGAAESIPSTARELQGKYPKGANFGIVTAPGSEVRWLNGVVPYTVHSSLNAALIESAIAHVESSTGVVDFVPWSGQADYVQFVPDPDPSSCYAYAGRIGGAQPISLGQYCNTMRIVAHEIGHTLGMFHEQSRCDRDNYVTIHFENIIPGKESQFAQMCSGSQGVRDVSTYNEGSLMHYGPYDFSKNGYATISSKTGAQVGGATGLTWSDIYTIQWIQAPPETPLTAVSISGPDVINTSGTYTWEAMPDGGRANLYTWTVTFSEGLGSPPQYVFPGYSRNKTLVMDVTPDTPPFTVDVEVKPAYQQPRNAPSKAVCNMMRPPYC